MIQKKICMIGTSGVGKTSLVSRFVHSIFSEQYLTTVGVFISKKSVVVEGNEVILMIWDLSGDDDFQRLDVRQLRGTSAYMLVADGTRAITLDVAIEIQQRVASAIGPLPFVLAVNKTDLQSLWEVQDERIASLAAGGWTIIKTSAKTGMEVDDAFGMLAERALRCES
jgi:small GTP-binding protein